MSSAVEIPGTAEADSQDVFGVRCFAGTLDGAVESVLERVRSRVGGYAVLCNVHVLMTVQDHPQVHGAVDGAWRVFPDGAPIAWLQRRLGIQAAVRVGGPDLMLGVMDRGRAAGLRHAFIGSTDETLQRLGERLRARLPGVEFAGMLAPPFGDPEVWSAAAVEELRSWHPDIVWLALGAPKQEMWMRSHANALAPALVIGVGAAFEFHAETRRRAPLWMQRAGLEWVHRLCSEPRRLFRRYLTTNTAFLLRVIGFTFRSRHTRDRVSARDGGGTG